MSANTQLPLREMSVVEKLRVLEQLWEDLLRNAEEIESPRWHKDVLAARAARVKSGEARFEDMADVKTALRERFS